MWLKTASTRIADSHPDKFVKTNKRKLAFSIVGEQKNNAPNEDFV